MIRKRWFLLANAALLLLYLWTLTEESQIQIRVDGGVCTALISEEHDLARSSAIPCPGLRAGFVGLYLSEDDSDDDLIDWGPLDWLAPRAGWRKVTFTQPGEDGQTLRIKFSEQPPGWRQVLGEWQPLQETAVLLWQPPPVDDYLVSAELRRPAERAGILLLEADGENGWAYITTPNGRHGVWWRWQEGNLAEPLVGIPYQKSTLAQAQSLLRRLLRAHQGALLLLGSGWLLVRFGQRLRRALERSRAQGTLRPTVPWHLSPNQDRAIVIAIALLVLGAAATIASDILERLPHVQDSVTYMFQAQLLARGKLWAAAPPLPNFFEQEFLTVRDGRWFGQYSPGFPLLLAAGVLLDQPWLVNPLLAALTIPLLYMLGRTLFSRSTGLIVIFLALSSPFFLFLSGSLMAHAAELFWLTGFMLCWTLSLRRKGRRWPILAGVALGMLLLTRQAALVASALPFLIVMSISEWSGNKHRRRLVASWGWMLAGALPLAALMFLYQGAITGDPFRDPRLLERPFDRPGFGAAIGESHNTLRLSLVEGKLSIDWYTDPDQPPRGHTLARGLNNTEQNWRALEVELFGWLPLFTTAFVWLIFLTRKPGGADVALLAVLGGTLITYVFYWSNGIMYGPRYYYSALPALFLLMARGIEAAAGWLGQGGKAAVALIVALLILGNLLFTLPVALERYRGFNFVSGQERAAVEQMVGESEQALVFVTNNPANWWEYGSFFSGNTPWLDGPIVYARDVGSDANRRLLDYFAGYTPYLWRDGRLVPLP